MGEARRKTTQGLSSDKKKNNMKNKDLSPQIFSWFPTTQKQENMFIRLSIRGAWIGIGFLVLLWVIVRIIGPAAGWWVPADLK